MTEPWPDVARREYGHYRRLLELGQVSDVQVERYERELLRLFPLLLDEITSRDVVLTRVRALLGGDNNLYDLPANTVITAAELRAALDEKEN